MLAVLGAGALLLYKGLKGKGTGAEGQKLAEAAADVVADTVKTAAEKSDVVKTVQQAAQQVSQQATEAVNTILEKTPTRAKEAEHVKNATEHLENIAKNTPKKESVNDRLARLAQNAAEQNEGRILLSA